MKLNNNIEIALKNNKVTLSDLSDWTKIPKKRLEEILLTREIKKRELLKVSDKLNIRENDLAEYKRRSLPWIARKILHNIKIRTRITTIIVIITIAALTFYVLMCLLFVLFSEVVTNYLFGKEIDPNHIALLPVFGAVFFGFLGLIVNVSSPFFDIKTNVSASIIIHEKNIYLEISNKFKYRLSMIYIRLTDFSIDQNRQLAPKHRIAERIDIENINFRGVPLESNEKYRIWIANADAIRKMEKNLRLSFHLILKYQTQYYEFPLKSFIPDF